MWTRGLLKQNAKDALRGKYWGCFLVTLVTGILTGGTGGSGGRAATSAVNGGSSFGTHGSVSPEVVITAVGIVLVGLAVGIAWSCFVAGPLGVGMNRFFMENRQSKTPFSTLWSVFGPGYLNIVKVNFLVNLKIALGFLLIIPGIYWGFCYALVPYLLAENPYMTTSRAMELSKELMEGEKWNYFVLGLSFIGWLMLGALCLGIGTLFVMPYIEATFAEFYAAMRSKAFAAGVSDEQELGGFVRHD